ncbi:MAG: hypothetical protein E6G76_14850 [Alphaproteobacteria bacterium]|jgi:hypothetical protein|nr:MAG: hypothetical protein E6G76_14850 [Alphaproteobacteria bacterium]
MRQLFVSTTAILLLAATASVAQETSLVGFPTSADNTQYTRQHVIEVDDVPGHQIRVFAIRRTFPKDPPIIGGLALKEQLSRGLTDYISNSGTGNFYGTYVLENGDKFFTRSSLVAHKAGAGLSSITVGRITGGTGKFATMQGEVRTLVTSDQAAGINEGFTTIEYVLNPETDAKASRAPAAGQR